MDSTLRSSDALAFSRFLATAGLGLTVLMLVSSLGFLVLVALDGGAMGLSTGVPVRLATPTATLEFSGADGALRYDTFLQFREVTDAVDGLRGAMAVPVESPLAAAAMLLAIAWVGGLSITFFRLLRALLGDARAGHPFTVVNAERVRDLGYVVLAFTLGGWLWRAIGGVRLSGQRVAEFLEVRPLLEVNAPALLSGLLLLALAAVWRHGVELEEQRRALEEESRLTV